MYYDHICKVNCFTKANRIAEPQQIGWDTQTHGVLCMFVYHVSLWPKQNRRGEKWKISFLLATMPGPRKVKLKIWRFWGSWRPCQNQLIWFFWFIKPTWFLYFTKIAWYLQTLCSQSWLFSDYKREKKRTTSAFRP